MTSLAMPDRVIEKINLDSSLQDKWASLKKKRYEEYTLAKRARDEARSRGADSQYLHAEEQKKLLRFGLVANMADELSRSRDLDPNQLNLRCYDENRRINHANSLLLRTAEMSRIIRGLREDVCAHGNWGFDSPMPLQARYRLAECDFYDDCVNVFRRKIENRTLTEEDYSHIKMFFEKFNKDPAQRFPKEGFSL